MTATETGAVASGRRSALWVDDVTVSFDGFRALNHLTLVLAPGELRCIIGPNGAGKTTMMDVITGKTRPDSGRVFMDGQLVELTTLQEHEVAAHGVGRKFQRPTVFEKLTVFENLELACKANKGVFSTLWARLSSEQSGRIDEALRTVGLAAQREALAGLLAHGQKQWLEIGMLLVQDPKVMLVDEPVAGMTHQEIDRTAELLVALSGERTVVVVEHDMEFVRRIARTVTVLHEGSVLAEGDMDHVQNHPQVIEVYLGHMSALLQIDKLNQHYGESHTLWDLTLDMRVGDCLVVMGRNGVGKTTLLKAVMGLLPAKGAVRFEGQDLLVLKAEERARRGIGYVPQGREIFGQLTVEENLRTGLIARSDGLRDIPPMIFDLFPVLKDMLGRRGGDLSGGQQQQLAIGRALACDPKLLILDEPTEGIQPNVVQQIGDVVERLRASRIAEDQVADGIKRANREYGITVLLVEQKLPFARRLGQRFAILDRGRVVAQGAMGELGEDLVTRYLKV